MIREYKKEIIICPSGIRVEKKTYTNGNIFCYIEGTNKYHMEDGPAAVFDDIEQWAINGNLHREGGPAYLSGQDRLWYKHGLLHQEDGPAIEDYGGNKEYWLNGQRCLIGDEPVKNAEEFEKWKKLSILI